MKYKGIVIVAIGIIIAISLSMIPLFHDLVRSLAQIGAFGAVAIGIFFVSTLTVATSLLALSYLSEIYSPVHIALLAGVGAVIGDLLIFRFVRDNLANELKSVIYKIPGVRSRRIIKIIHNHYFAWILPFVGAVIVASPLPDELGVSLLGLSKISKLRFIIISYLLNAVGIFILLEFFR